jgi:aryl-alcohol dehydrogenase-like predicted oxidoreductase
VDTVVLGRTGLVAGVMGLGAGGHSRLGQSTGHSEADSIAVVRRALELGVNLFDTAEGYGTELLVARALSGVPRDRYILSTKKNVTAKDRRLTADEFTQGVLACLQRLQVDYVDIFHLHGVKPQDYDYAVNEIVPALQKLQAAGAVRYLGITESFGSDTQHAMLSRAVQDDCWGVMMVGFNILNQTARERVFPHTRAKRIGTLIMFAVRRALTSADQLRPLLAKLVEQGHIDRNALDLDDPLGFLTAPGVAGSLAEAAYRFCRYEPGVDVVLSGTGNLAHLEENYRSLHQPPLPAAVAAQLRVLLGRVDTESGN